MEDAAARTAEDGLAVFESAIAEGAKSLKNAQVGTPGRLQYQSRDGMSQDETPPPGERFPSGRQGAGKFFDFAE